MAVPLREQLGTAILCGFAGRATVHFDERTGPQAVPTLLILRTEAYLNRKGAAVALRHGHSTRRIIGVVAKMPLLMHAKGHREPGVSGRSLLHPGNDAEPTQRGRAEVGRCRLNVVVRHRRGPFHPRLFIGQWNVLAGKAIGPGATSRDKQAPNTQHSDVEPSHRANCDTRSRSVHRRWARTRLALLRCPPYVLARFICREGETMPGRARADLGFEEPLIFELGAEGRSAVSGTDDDLPLVDPSEVLGTQARSEPARLPEVSEPEAFRHYVRLSQQNFAIDKGMYPLGSCTMKYNPKVNEWAARLPGFSRLHPMTPTSCAQGALELMYRLERALAEICGMDHVSLHPAAGAQGELTGLMMVRAYHRSQGRSPKKVLIPHTAHGTNPASCSLNGLKAVPFPAGDNGIVDPAALAASIDDDVAAIMITNPNTVGLFETHLPEVAQLVHDKGGLVYGDGANLNAIMGLTRPGDLGIDVMQFNLHKTFTTPHGGGGPGCGPVGYKAKLHPFAPVPVCVRGEDGTFELDYNRPESVGRLRAFHGNFGMMVRAYTYVREMGAEGLRRASELAVLNANYIRARLGEAGYHIPYDQICMHEVVASDRHLKETGVTTMDVAKRLLDYGFHAPTVYFPLVVKGALLIEPTETETKQAADEFVDALAAISGEAKAEPETVRNAPHLTRLRRLDETRAARNPVLRHRFKDASA